MAIQLPAFTESESARLSEVKAPGASLRIGFGRSIPGQPEIAASPGKSHWHELPGGGQAFAVRLTSPGALAIRLGVRVLDLPDQAILRFFSPGAPQARAVSGAAVKASVQRNLAAGAVGEAAEIYWSPSILGEVLVLEVDLPAGVAPDRVRIALPRLSHFFRLSFAETDVPTGAEADCQEDSTCRPQWDGPSRATAMFLHMDEDGDTGVCTGTLLNDADPSTYIPYFLTAHHCISDQVRASGIETYWLLRSSRCGGPADGYRSVAGGADLLYAEKTTDTSFLRLREPPPPGAVFSGWSATLPVEGTALAGIHHPFGARQKIAVGALAEYVSCKEIDYCGEGADPESIHYLRVRWARGATLPGSSGSGLFLGTGELVGALSGGFSRCGSPDGPDDYGRFDLPYRAALYRWLGQKAASISSGRVARDR
jgi:lysyl endopeptidase